MCLAFICFFSYNWTKPSVSLLPSKNKATHIQINKPWAQVMKDYVSKPHATDTATRKFDRKGKVSITPGQLTR